MLEDSLPDLEAAIGLPWPVDRRPRGHRGRPRPRSRATPASSTRATTRSRSARTSTTSSSSTRRRTPGSTATCSRSAGSARASPTSTPRGSSPPTTRTRAQEDPLPVARDRQGGVRPQHLAPPNRIDDDSAAYERFGYDASWTVMRAIVDDVTEARMRDVFKAAAARTLTYAGAGPAERVGVRRRTGAVPRPRDRCRRLDEGRGPARDVGPDAEGEGRAARARRGPDALLRRSSRAGGDWLPGIARPQADERLAVLARPTAAIDEAHGRPRRHATR